METDYHYTKAFPGQPISVHILLYFLLDNTFLYNNSCTALYCTTFSCTAFHVQHFTEQHFFYSILLYSISGTAFPVNSIVQQSSFRQFVCQHALVATDIQRSIRLSGVDRGGEHGARALARPRGRPLVL